MRIENGTIEIFDPMRSPSSTLLLREVNATFTPLAGQGAADALSDRRKLTGTLSGDFFRHVTFEGVVDPRRQTLAVDGSIEGLEISPELGASLPVAAAERLHALGAVRGEGELNFHVGYDPASPNPLEYAVRGRVSRGRIDDPRLPHPLTDIRAVVRWDNQGFAVENLTGRSNQATLRLSASGKAPGEGRPLTLTAEIRQLELDPELVASLPEDLQEQWYKHRPLGQIDADVKLQYDGRTWRPDLTLRGANLSFTHQKFPYRLEHGEGTVSLRDDALEIHLAAYSGNQQIRIDGQLQGPLSAPTGSIDIKGEDLPLDTKLFDALPERCRTSPGARSPRDNQLFSTPPVAAIGRRAVSSAAGRRCGPLLASLRAVSLLAGQHSRHVDDDRRQLDDPQPGGNQRGRRVTCRGELRRRRKGRRSPCC